MQAAAGNQPRTTDASGAAISDAGLTVFFLGSGDAFGDGGRFQACVLVEQASTRVMLDCGATSLTAMKRFGVDPGQIDAVVISHYHADHYGGLPFLILDGQFSHRDRPLAIIGPRGIERRVTDAMEASFPRSSTVKQRFPVTFHELTVGHEFRFGGASVLASGARHTPGSEALVLRLSMGAASIAYTGDTEWTAAIPQLAAGADLLICEAYSWRTRIPYHLDYPSLAAHRGDLAAKRVVLTHFGPEMLRHLDEVDEEVAHDGLRITL